MLSNCLVLTTRSQTLDCYPNQRGRRWTTRRAKASKEVKNEQKVPKLLVWSVKRIVDLRLDPPLQTLATRNRIFLKCDYVCTIHYGEGCTLSEQLRLQRFSVPGMRTVTYFWPASTCSDSIKGDFRLPKLDQPLCGDLPSLSRHSAVDVHDTFLNMNWFTEGNASIDWWSV